ncbi:hypothetical protein FHS57_001258 [Runella defluvii]|uniref:Uncharacterized protein n=1 Tax=Runella defluvii TaxID=370973 RepID=A0A7W5ZI22_9BACT|nr:hypothetical protein [Runella defluvii]MBB3837264.1 hypothetical protein [Runella defluvii]
MKKTFALFYSTLCLLYSTLLVVLPTLGGISTAFAQGGTDSVRLSHSEETGTLEKQRFIDRYDYVFMTKEPTKWMLKGYGNINNLLASNLFQKGYVKQVVDFRLGIERKLNHSFSIEIDASRISKVPLTEAGLIDYSSYYGSDNKCWATSAELRWYYDMASRIRQGKSSNNFSGNYLSLRYERLWQNEDAVATGLSGTNGKWNTDYFGSYYHSQLSLNYGIQRRFFRYGLIDFSIALNRNTNQLIHRKYTFLNGDNSIQQPLDWNNIQESITATPQHSWNISTNFKVGVALADFKKSSKIPACDVFQCFENENNLWKISWPRINLSTRVQAIRSSIGYEQKIAKSAFSINTYLNLSASNDLQKNTEQYDPATETYFTGNSQSLSLGAQLHIQPRWYFLMNRQMRAGKSGNNLSGIYAGLNNVFSGSLGFIENDRFKRSFDFTPMFINTGLLVGYQRKLFKNGFIDLNISKGLLNRHPYNLGPSNFILDFKLGFAL